jgi:hypothetical protein
MAKKSIALVPKQSNVLDLSHIFDNQNVDEAQAAHDALPADHRQKLTSALQTHLKAVVPSQEQKSVDPGNAPPAATHQDLEGQQQTEQSETLSDLSESGVPDTTPPKPIKLGQSSPVIPSSAPAKALKTPIASPSDKPDFSTL